MKTKYAIGALSLILAAGLIGSQAVSADKDGSGAKPPQEHSKQGPAKPGAKGKKENGQGTGGKDAAAPGQRPAAGTGAGANTTKQSGASSTSSTTTTINNESYTVTISGGFNTAAVDGGRPVVLIAAALGVPTEVFREAFSGVTPAGANSGGPTSEEAQANKAALMKVLSPYGITNERLDEVSNYYRYNGSKGEVWTRTLAKATAKVTNGVVTGVTITNAGAGYSSVPTITIKGPKGTVTATAVVSYTKDFKTNGAITAVTLK